MCQGRSAHRCMHPPAASMRQAAVCIMQECKNKHFQSNMLLHELFTRTTSPNVVDEQPAKSPAIAANETEQICAKQCRLHCSPADVRDRWLCCQNLWHRRLQAAGRKLKRNQTAKAHPGHHKIVKRRSLPHTCDQPQPSDVARPMQQHRLYQTQANFGENQVQQNC